MSRSAVFALILAFSLSSFGQIRFDAVCYSPIRDGQDPDGNGGVATVGQIREDIRILKKITGAVKILGINGQLGRNVVEVCHEQKMGIHVGCWLGNVNDPAVQAANRRELDDLVKIAGLGYPEVKSLLVGSETLLRNDMTAAQAIAFIQEVKTRTKSKYPVSTSQVYADYLRYRGSSTDIAAAVDFILYNGHPYWENVAGSVAGRVVVERWKAMRAAFPGRPMMIGETGWPTQGASRSAAVPGDKDQLAFLQNFLAEKKAYEASGADTIHCMLFEAFDEAWNRGEGEVGAHWGLFYGKRTPKPAVTRLLGQAGKTGR
jgi:exo-beta-1,3-glucanase (GH17 family)